MLTPHVRFVGRTCAILSYVRLVQTVDVATGAAASARAEETRVWELHPAPKDVPTTFESEKARWLHVHFHRSQWE
jgi:hypothetical protein